MIRGQRFKVQIFKILRRNFVNDFRDKDFLKKILGGQKVIGFVKNNFWWTKRWVKFF